MDDGWAADRCRMTSPSERKPARGPSSCRTGAPKLLRTPNIVMASRSVSVEESAYTSDFMMDAAVSAGRGAASAANGRAVRADREAAIASAMPIRETKTTPTALWNSDE